jgi:hypothetical protein
MTNVKDELKSWVTIIGILIAAGVLGAIMGLIGRLLGFEGEIFP